MENDNRILERIRVNKQRRMTDETKAQSDRHRYGLLRKGCDSYCTTVTKDYALADTGNTANFHRGTDASCRKLIR